VVIVRGLRYPTSDDAHASDLIRPKHLDLYG
jgi:F420-0:gamma-glutamyl ligase